VPVTVDPDPFVQSPQTNGLLLPVANVIVFDVLADISIEPIAYASFNVTVDPEFSPVASKIHVSCASGKLLTAGEPPLDVAQAVADQIPPEGRFQYLLTAAVNVIPLLPLQSPKRVPAAGAAAPAITTSLKSTSVKETDAHVNVRTVPITSERTNIRPVASVPAKQAKVPSMTWFDASTKFETPSPNLPVTVKLLNVFEPVIDGVDNPEEVNVTLLKATPSKAAMAALADDKFTWDEPPENVKLGAIAVAPKFIAVFADNVIVPDPRSIDLVLLLLLNMAAAKTL